MSVCRRSGSRLLAALLLTLLSLEPSAGSEFPERECCDSIPPLPAQFTTPPVSAGTEPAVATPSTTAKPSVRSKKTSPPTIDCKTARQLCDQDPACQGIASVIPRLCGPEIVSCSTVTVTKCRAALRTLVSFQFFQPTCLCKEPRMDPECNTYRNLVFDHPCFNAHHQDGDQYPEQSLLTCDHALTSCLQHAECSHRYEAYLNSCPFQQDVCQMRNSSTCLDAWNQLKLSPVFACICPNPHQRECRNTFDAVHANPCIVHVLSGGGGGLPPADPALVAPLFERGSERPRPSVMERTLHGKRELDNIINANRHPHQGSWIPEIDQQAAPAEVVQSSCHTARDNCLRDDACRMALQPVLDDCSPDSCSRQLCQQRLQLFYSQSDSALVQDVAFCVCRRSPGGDGGCLQAMQQLHPACARQPPPSGSPSCQAAARQCRRQPDGRCRPRLERFEQACAVDVLTQRCAGPTADCRLALLGVLGTQLRSQCTCEGPAAGQLDSCRSWQRLLWENPCVALTVQAFNRGRGPLRLPGIDSTPPPRSTTRLDTGRHRNAHRARHRDRQRQRQRQRQRNEQWSGHRAGSESRRPPVTTGINWELPLEGTTPARQTTAGTGHRAAYCTHHRREQVLDRIPVGSGVRYYRLDDSADKYAVEKECSELCMCHPRARLICNVMDCVEKKRCQSSMANYPHGSAGLLPFREGCICYHGDFVCMRPAADDYTLSFGVFLFLGYSRSEEDSLRPHTAMSVEGHLIRELENLLDLMMKQKGSSLQNWPCKLSMRQHFKTSHNVIVQAKLAEVEKSYNQSINQKLLSREKSKCVGPLKDISFMVNNRESEILSHPLLSVLKVADLEVTIPDLSHAGEVTASLFCLLLCLALPLAAAV